MKPADSPPAAMGDRVLVGLLVLLGVLLLLELVVSLRWRMQHDTPLLHYVAFLIDEHHRVPYRDIFVTSMVGSLYFHLGIGKLLGYSDVAFRLVDIAHLGCILGCTWMLMRPFGRRVAVSAPLLYGLVYIGFGPTMSLQRDHVGLLPIVVALLLVTRDAPSRYGPLRALVIGSLFAIASSFKPHLAVGLPVVLVYMATTGRVDRASERHSTWRLLARSAFYAAAGYALTLLLLLAWLWQQDGLSSLWDMLTGYMPLHLRLTGGHETIAGFDRWVYLFESFQRLGNLGALLLPVSLGSYLAMSESTSGPRAWLTLLLLALLGTYALYPVLAGQFWSYHWMPFAYFASLCASLVVLPPPVTSRSTPRRLLPLVVFLFFLVTSIRPAGEFVRGVLGRPPEPPEEGRADAIAAFLDESLRPGDTVQPLDWTGGALHGMLISRAVVATRFIYDYHFYHHVSVPYIRQLRREFVHQLRSAPPRFVIDVEAKPRPRGDDTTGSFPELQRFLDEGYVSVHDGRGFRILERRSRELVGVEGRRAPKPMIGDPIREP